MASRDGAIRYGKFGRWAQPKVTCWRCGRKTTDTTGRDLCAACSRKVDAELECQDREQDDGR